MKRFLKKAQFFLLAAVIISVVVVSLNAMVNHATVKDEPESFYDFSYEVQREVGATMDYEIYTVSSGELEDIVDMLSKKAKDDNPSAEFMFIYGDNVSGVKFKNYGKVDGSVEGEVIPAGGELAINKICLKKNQCKKVEDFVTDFDPDVGTLFLDSTELDNVAVLSVEINGKDFDFPISDQRQIIFIMQKDLGDENYVSVK